MEENALRGVLGWKGERGYSAYEIAVQNGFVGSEKDFLSQLGTTSHFSEDSVVHISTANQTSFELPATYVSDSIVDIYVNGFKLNVNEYTVDESTMKINLVTALDEGAVVEIVVKAMGTNKIRIKHYNSVSTMKTDTTIEHGNMVHTLGYHEVNDGGAADYRIREKTEADVEDNGSIIFLDNGLVAELKFNNYLEPAQFNGNNDYERLLNCYTYVLNNPDKNISILLSKMYDLTGHSLDLNRHTQKWSRKQIYFIGIGGGFIKNDSGYMFTSSDSSTGDFNFSNIKFYSTKETGTIIFNFNNIIRTKILNCEFRNVDTIGEANTECFQSIIIENNTINEGAGWKLTAKQYLDTVIMNNLVEDCEHFMCNSENLNSMQNICLRVMNNCIENLKGTTLKLGTSYNVNIENNYIELNNEYFDLATLNTYGHMALTIKNNHFNVSNEQKTNNVPCIKLSNTATTGKTNNGGCFSSGNTSNGVLYELLFDSSSFITGIGDMGTINGTRYINLGKPNYEHSGELQSFGGVHSFSKSYFNIPITPNEEVKSQIELPFVYKSHYMIDAKTTNKYFEVVKIIPVPESNIVDVTIKNNAATGDSCTLNVNIMYFDVVES